MKTINIISAFLSFILLFIGVGLLLWSSVEKNFFVMYFGLGLLILASMGYIYLFIAGILWLKKKSEE